MNNLTTIFEKISENYDKGFINLKGTISKDLKDFLSSLNYKVYYAWTKKHGERTQIKWHGRRIKMLNNEEKLLYIKGYVLGKFGNLKRESGEFAYTHSLGMEEILKQTPNLNTYELRAVALLHDIIEDTNTSLLDLKKDIPFLEPEILRAVNSLTKYNGMSLEDSLLLAQGDSLGRVIKGLDRYQNALTTYNTNSQEFISGFIYKSVKFYLPVLKESNNPFIEQLIKELKRLKTYLIPKADKWLKENLTKEQYKILL